MKQIEVRIKIENNNPLINYAMNQVLIIEMSILLADLDSTILSYCDLEDDFFNVMLINQHYYKLVINNDLFLDWKLICRKISKRRGVVRDKFQAACQYGCIMYCKYLLKKYPINLHKYEDSPFGISCKNGHLHIAKWLMEISNNAKQKITININCVFGWSCYYGKFDIVKWLIDLSNKDDYYKINIHDDDEFAFKFSCNNGHFDIAKWLIELSNKDGYKKININTDDDFAFRFSCEKGHFDIAKWLIELSNQDGYGKIDIHIWNNDIYRQCIENYHFDIVKWLIELSNTPEYVPFNDELLSLYDKKINSK